MTLLTDITGLHNWAQRHWFSHCKMSKVSRQPELTYAEYVKADAEIP